MKSGSAARTPRPLQILVTCGPTREPLDPVRFISNRSTGTLGFAIARAFAARGHRVTLAVGPVQVPSDLGSRIRVTRFETARELHRLALKEFKPCDALCMTAAVADFRPAAFTASKIKRGPVALTVKLVPNPDILADLGRRKRPGQTLIGFAVESSAVSARAQQKLLKKNLDLMVAQKVGRGADPFGAVPMNTLLVRRKGSDGGAAIGEFKRDQLKLSGVSKARLAALIVRFAEAARDQNG